MKRFSLVFATSILAVAILFGSLINQTSTAHASSISPAGTVTVTTAYKNSTFSLSKSIPYLQLFIQLIVWRFPKRKRTSAVFCSEQDFSSC
jgi:hypothetical protein